MDLTASQGHLLVFLARCAQPPCPRDMEAKLQLSHATVSGLLARLEKKAFVQLLPDPDDRRCKRVHLTARSRACLAQMAASIRAMNARLVQGFSEEDQSRFAELLNRAITNMGGNACHPDPKEES